MSVRIGSLFVVMVVGLSVVFTSGPALADYVTGDPTTATGWVQAGNSLDSGTYIRGAGNFGYDNYSAAFAIPSGSSLVTSGWSVGDTVLGIGGKIATNDGVSAGWGSAFTGDAVNTVNLTTSVRIVAKFGSSPTSWSASTIRPDAGNGNGSLSSGHGGVGAILLGTEAPPNSIINEGNDDTLLTLSVNQRYDGVGTPSISSSVGRIIFVVDDISGLLSSWQVFLNTSVLANLLPPATDIPQIGDRISMTLQRSTNSTLFTDALVTAAVPEPSAFLFGGLVCGVLGLGVAAQRFWARRQTEA